MKQGPNQNNWKQLDRDLDKISQFDFASKYVSRPLLAPGIALLFIIVCGIAVAFFLDEKQSSYIVIIAAVIGAYMALNIGANDVANNVGPAVGAKALTMGGALVIAAICESAGAILAGGDVVTTISKGIINPASVILSLKSTVARSLSKIDAIDIIKLDLPVPGNPDNTKFSL